MTTLPAELVAASIRGERVLDVRPVLSKKGDPFHLIIRTLREVQAGEALHLVVGFEPRPLYPILRFKGWRHVSVHDGDAWHVYFYKKPKKGAEPAAEQEEPEATPDERAPLQPWVSLDVRGLEPPQPMMRILETLTELGPGGRLEVAHHREPILLYEKLSMRGYAAQTEKLPDGDFRVRIAPAWSFES